VAKVFGEDDGDRLMEIVKGLMGDISGTVNIDKQDKKSKTFELQVSGSQKGNKH
jgi:hypothetical protein